MDLPFNNRQLSTQKSNVFKPLYLFLYFKSKSAIRNYGLIFNTPIDITIITGKPNRKSNRGNKIWHLFQMKPSSVQNNDYGNLNTPTTKNIKQ